jgi:NH3-dependent NAD+ synthetase
MNISVDKAGDLKLGKRKCRLHKKEDVVKVAKKYNINTEKKTIKQLCDSIKKKVKTTPMTKDKALTSIDRMNIANYNKLKLRALLTKRSPGHVVRVARELARLR